MKKIVFLFALLIIYTLSVYGNSQDTTITAKLNEGNKQNNISLKIKENKITKTEDGKKYTENIYLFTLTIDGKSITDTIPYNDYAGADIIDINKNDKTKEILITSGGDNDYYSFWVYNFTNIPQLMLTLDGYNDFEPDGAGNATAHFWTGFCRLTDNYKLSKDGNKLDKIQVDFYPVKKWTEEGETEYDAKVVKSFKLFSERDNKSEIIAETKPGEKIIISGYDSKYITVKDTSDDSIEKYIWIQMKTQNGKTGWILMSAYNTEDWNKILEGVMFAG